MQIHPFLSIKARFQMLRVQNSFQISRNYRNSIFLKKIKQQYRQQMIFPKLSNNVKKLKNRKKKSEIFCKILNKMPISISDLRITSNSIKNYRGWKNKKNKTVVCINANTLWT